MDYRVKWSPEAAEDVEEIAHYIEKDSPRYAHAITEDIIAASRALRQLPLRGRMVPELEDETHREIFIYSYRLIYRVKKDQLLIIAVIHGKRRLENIDDRFIP